MQLAFEQAFTKTRGVEGDYSNDKNDPGGKTRFGVTELVARANGYTGAMRDLPFATAKAIMKAQYWDLLRLDEVAKLSQAIAEELFDTGVNQGVSVAATFLQGWLNVFNHQQKDYPDIYEDGNLGPVTVHVLGEFMRVRASQDGERVMLAALNADQGVRYKLIAQNKPTQEDYAFGWIRQRVRI